MRSVVSIVKCADYSKENVLSATASAIELASLSELLQDQPKVLLKPNLLAARSPEHAVTTHPAVVRAVGKIAKDVGCRVSVGDSPPFAGESESKYAKLCDATGVTAVARELGIDIARFEENVTQVSNPSGRYYHSFDIAQAVIDADVLINLPKLKTHGLTLFSGAVKNLFGCVPGIKKGLFHVQSADDREIFAQMLVDLLSIIRPKVNIMDAIIGMEGEGPNGGKPRQTGLLLASSDPVALDAVACSIIGLDPMSVHTTRFAHERGLGCGNLSEIRIVGERLEDVTVRGFVQSSGTNEWVKIPAQIRKALRKQLIASPQISAARCVGCGDCVRVCPLHIISSGHPPNIDLTECIRCYCCHEVCNLNAIELKRGWLGNLLFRLFKKT